MLSIVTVILVLIMLIVLIITLIYYNKSYTEHMVNIKAPTQEITWSTDPKCGYEMTQVYLDILKEYNIKQNNKDWTIYFPCTYNGADTEINKVKPANPDQRVFIISNTDDISSN